MTTEIKKEGEFDPRCVLDLQDDLHLHNWGLRAFGELLQSSNLKEFSDEGEGLNVVESDIDRANLRHGLKQIIELYLDRQEKIVSKYVEQYNNSDESLVLSAASTICMFKNGAFDSPAAADRLGESIKEVEVVISRGGELAEEAKKLKEMCHQHLRSTIKTEQLLIKADSEKIRMYP